jgi:uncharacterized coiled-coil DUF342 family protein
VRLDESHSLIAGLVPKLDGAHQDILKQLAARDDRLEKEFDKLNLGIKSIDKSLKDSEEAAKTQKARERLLHSLKFSSMQQRRKDVQDRVRDYGDTFQWILKPKQPHGFLEWFAS